MILYTRGNYQYSIENNDGTICFIDRKLVSGVDSKGHRDSIIGHSDGTLEHSSYTY